MIERPKCKSRDWDDCWDPGSTKFSLTIIERELGIEFPEELYYAPREVIIARLMVTNWEEALDVLNMPWKTKEYLERPLPPQYVEAVKISAQKHEELVITSRPPKEADWLLEKADRAGILKYLRGGIHHVKPGQTKLEVGLEAGIDEHTDDYHGHIATVASAPHIQTFAIVNTTLWNSDSALLEVFGNNLPPNVEMIPHLGHVLTRGLDL